jgi:hypothetical protein
MGEVVGDMGVVALEDAELGHLREEEEPIVFHDLRHTFGTLAVQVWPVTKRSCRRGDRARCEPRGDDLRRREIGRALVLG